MSHAGRPTLGRAARCVVESLEERILFAWNMTLSNNALAGVSVTPVKGATAFTATATGANIPWADIQTELSKGNNVVVNTGTTGSEAGNITDSTGGQLSFSTSNRTLTIQSASGSGLSGNISIKDITLSGAGSSIVLTAGGSVSTGQLSGGTYASPTPLTSASITANNGSISAQTSPFPGPIEATTVTLKASTGIGTATTAIPTVASNLSAQTSTGGIYISNIGSVAISASNPITAGSGTVSLTVNGSISETGTGTAITAGTLALQAITGIGTSPTPLVTVVSTLTAQTVTGGIFVSNTGNLTIFSGNGLNGMWVSSSGSIALTNAGNITATGSNNAGGMNAPDSLTVTTTSGNILLGGFNDAYGGGGVAIHAAGDLLMGDTARKGRHHPH